MISYPESRPLDQDELEFKRRALRDAILCIGWLKLTSILCFLLLYFIVRTHSKGDWSTIIQILILVAIPLVILHGILLFFGALEESPHALEGALWLCLILASYDTVLGIIGGIYFIRTGYLIIHFVLAIAFAILASSLFISGTMLQSVFMAERSLIDTNNDTIGFITNNDDIEGNNNHNGNGANNVLLEFDIAAFGQLCVENKPYGR